MKKKICIITSSRAEYGLLKNVLKKIYASNKFLYHLSVTGTHLSFKHGYTYKEIRNDRIKINSKLDILNIADNEAGISKTFSNGILKFSRLFKKINPDLILVLGDKFEIMSSVISATLHRVPIAHIHGGEATQGAIDDVIRNSISKMSHIHFTSTSKYRDRVIQMGENPKSVFCVGALGVENINKHKFKDIQYFKKKYKIDFKKRSILICFHPVTLEPNTEEMYLNKILESLKYFKDCNLIFTAPNADHGYKKINNMINSFVKKNLNSFYIKSFGRTDFISCLKLSNIILGNSSSGIIEAPSLKTHTINLGNRQKGRIKSKSVIDCKIETKSIRKNIKKIFNIRIKKKNKYFFNPYFKKDSSKRIIKILANLDYKNLINKKFFDK